MKKAGSLFLSIAILFNEGFSFCANEETATVEIIKQTIMENNNYTTSFLTDRTPQEVFDAINNVCAWWSEDVEGDTKSLNGEFLYYYKDVHISKMQITEFIPNKKVVWLVLENHFNFTNDQNEWKGNRIVFEITEKDGKTKLDFTQEGLTPEYECFDVCQDAWTSYIQGSLKALIETGKGRPNVKEGGLNRELIEKWNLRDKQAGTNDFTCVFSSSLSPGEVFPVLLDVRQWWSGLYSETISGESENVGDEFTFSAGDGVHYSKHKLIEAVRGEKIAWLVNKSSLSFATPDDEWTGTKVQFEISKTETGSEIRFTHQGLNPRFECYDNCSAAWTQYLENLEEKLR